MGVRDSELCSHGQRSRRYAHRRPRIAAQIRPRLFDFSSGGGQKRDAFFGDRSFQLGRRMAFAIGIVSGPTNFWIDGPSSRCSSIEVRRLGQPDTLENGSLALWPKQLRRKPDHRTTSGLGDGHSSPPWNMVETLEETMGRFRDSFYGNQAPSSNTQEKTFRKTGDFGENEGGGKREQNDKRRTTDQIHLRDPWFVCFGFLVLHAFA